jgi:hypothetical protein
MDKQVTLNKIEQLITNLNRAHSTTREDEKHSYLEAAASLAIQIRQQIRKA